MRIEQSSLFEPTLTPPASPKLFQIEKIGAIQATYLNSLWHSRLPQLPWSNVVRSKHYVCYGIVFNGDFYGVGIWSSPVAANRLANGWTMLELRRLALREECPFNTATWFLSQMRKTIAKNLPFITRLISYQDTEVHIGTIYKADNWLPAAETPFLSWGDTRERNPDQSTATKIRWEYNLEK